MILCSYGCGKESKFKLKNGKPCCSKFASQCIVIREMNRNKHIGRKLSSESIEKVRQSKIGDKNPMKRIDVREKVRTTLTGKTYDERFGKEKGNELKERSRKRMLNGGSKHMNSFPISGFSSRKEFCKHISFIPKSPDVIRKAVEKNRKIKEEKGVWTRTEDLSDWKLYRRTVWSITNISAKEKYSKEDLKQRGRKKSLNHKQLDHIFSIYEGFKFGILPMIIGSRSNIRLVDCSYNCSKHSRCDITLEELFDLFDKEKNKT